MHRALFALAALVLVPAAFAHGRSYEGFVSTVSGIDPLMPGLIVQVLESDERLALRNFTSETVIVFDRRGRPLVRIAPGDTRA